MKLLSCYVENFGKLCNYELMFYKDITCFEEENSWGKSTFSAFLKAMLYGFEEDTHPHSERNRYRPWNGGPYGGAIVFTHQGVSYRQERYFGKDIHEDTIVVTDLSQNKPSTLFDQGIGDVIWQVNKDSYEKTAYFSFQGSPLYNELIVGKLIDREDETAHRSEAERGLRKLSKAMKSIQSSTTLKMSSGLIGKQERQLEKLKIQLEKSQQAETSFHKDQQRWKQYDDKLTQVMAQLEKNQEQLTLSALRDQYQVYLDLQEQERLLRQEKEDSYDFLSTPPTPSQLEEWEAICHGFIHWEEEKKERTLTKNEETTYTRQQGIEMPTSDFIQDLQQKIFKITEEIPSQVAQLQNEITILKGKLKSEYIGRQVNLSFVNKGIDEYPRLQQQEMDLKETIHRINNEMKEESHEVFPKIWLAFAFLCFLFGTSSLMLSLLSRFPSTLINILCLGMGLTFYTFTVAILVRMFFFNKNNMKDIALSREQQEAIARFQKELDHSIYEREKYERYAARLGGGKHNVVPLFYELQKVNDLNEEIIEKELDRGKVEKSIQGLRKEVESELLRYFKPPYDPEYQVDLEKIIQLKKDYQRLCEKKELYADANNNLQDLLAKWHVHMMPFPTLRDLTPMDALNQVRIGMPMLKKLEEDLRVTLEKQKTFQALHDMSQFQGLEQGLPSEDQLRTTRAKLEKEQKQLCQTMDGISKNQEELQRQLRLLPSIKGQMAQCEQEIVSLKENYDLLKNTHLLLEQASESISVKYNESMGQSFHRYLEYMDEVEGIDGAKYHINQNLEVEMTQDGQTYGSHLLSNGTQDLLQLCMRFALIDSIYQNVPPPLLILDDPFVNFDDVKMNYARKLLEKISMTHQIIYFSCHSSRALERTTPIS